ncbi:MAG: hypothetical protein J0H49_27710 [Acidobacteria bacterium]|nr:hypothetical protein [Acidobacteriota bacterium]
MHFLFRSIIFATLLPILCGSLPATEAWSSEQPLTEPRRWINAREYELGRRASEQARPEDQIQALTNWEAAFPESDFDRERSMLFVEAYRRAGRWNDAFMRAAKRFMLPSSEVAESMMVVDLAMQLSNPTENQIAIIRKAARNLLDQAAGVGRSFAAAVPAEEGGPTQGKVDPETQRLLNLIREWRKGKHIRTAAEVEAEIRQRAEKVMEWASQH